MGSSKIGGRKRSRPRRSNGDPSENLRNFRNLFPVIQSPEGMKPPVLKNLYSLLLNLSSNAEWTFKHAVGSDLFDLEICHDGIRVTFEDICELSNVLFRELEERFEQLFSNFCGTGDKDLGESGSCIGVFDDLEVMNLLFRCCMLLLPLLDVQQSLVLDKGQRLVRILRKLSLPNFLESTGKHAFVFEKSVFHECAPSDTGCSAYSAEDFTASLQFLEPYNPLYIFMSAMAEVFVDELLVHTKLGVYLKLINSVASTDEMLFNPDLAQGDIAIVMEAICNHFILSFSDKQAFGDFLSRLFCLHAKELKYPFRAPALGVTAAVSLFLSPIMVSAPRYIQAHLISLVSEAIDIKSVELDRTLTNCFLSTFEKSVILYMTNMSCLQRDGYSTFPRGSSSSALHDLAYSPFEIYILPETKKKVDDLITKLDNASNLNLNDSFCRMKSDLVSSSMRFVKECQNFFDMSCQDEVLAILSCLILKASESHDDKAVLSIGSTSLQHIYLLASLLKLMSISLLKAIWCLTHSDCGGLKTLKDFSSCKEYDSILGSMTCFRDLDISLPLQQVLSGVMLNHSTGHMDSKMMFLHFSGLMSLSFVSGIDCLVKACLLTMLALLNLFAFEEGSLDALQSIIDSNKESFSSGLPVVRFHESVVDQNSSLVVASTFQKIRSQHLSVMENRNNEMETSSSQASGSVADMEAVAGLEEETEETTNGEIFLKCMLNKRGNISDFDDLAGFVECKQGKDYSAWLKNRKKYRRWKFEKIAVLRWKRKKKTWKTCKVKRN